MSLSYDRIFTDTSLLKSYNVRIDDKDMFEEDVISLDINYDFNKFAISGEMNIKDSFGLEHFDMLYGKSKITIYGMDLHKGTFLRTFVITNTVVDTFNERFKMLRITFVDELYFKLSNTYMSKSFKNTDMISALEEYFEELEMDGYFNINDYFSVNKIEKFIDSIDVKEDFAVPHNVSLLDFFVKYFNYYGLRFFQTRSGVHVQKIKFNQLEHDQLNGDDVLYTNDTDNGMYAFYIFDHVMNYNNIINENLERPNILNNTYDLENKINLEDTKNLDDVYDDMKLTNYDMKDLVKTTGEKYEVTEVLSLENQQIEIENVYFYNNNMEIVVPGNYEFNDICKLIKVKMQGNVLVDESALEGDTFHSGDFFVSAITDKYVGNRMIQKLTINKLDLPKIRKGKK